MSDRAYRFNSAGFACEVFADEVLVLDVMQGTYFALGGVACGLWPGLAGAQPVARLVDAAAAHYGIAARVVQADLDSFIVRLLEEKILLEAEPGEDATPLWLDGAYHAPVFEKHADMEHLMTLDPIHDVDPEQG